MANVTQLYSKNDCQQWLDDARIIRRYVSLRTLILYVTRNLFIPSIAKLKGEDPFEGVFPWSISYFNKAMTDLYKNDRQDVEGWFFKNRLTDSERRLIAVNKDNPVVGDLKASIIHRHYLDFIRHTRFAWCWFGQSTDSAAMWSIYGRDGAAIESTVGQVKDVFRNAKYDVVYGPMEYVDIPEGQGFYCQCEELQIQPLFLKRKEYKHECEIRFIATGPEVGCRPGITIKLQTLKWIQKIWLAPTLNKSEVASITDLVGQMGSKVGWKPACEQSQLLKGPISEENWSLAEIYGEITNGCESDWDSGKDGIPQLLKRAVIARTS